MGNFDIDMDLYFWIVERAEIQDDPRNQVKIEQSRVSMHREHMAKLTNGVYLGQLMLNMRKIVIKKSKNPFALDP